MDEKILNQLISDIKAGVTASITEAFADKKSYEDKIAELDGIIASKDDEISELSGKCKKYEGEIEKCSAEINSLKDENVKLNNSQKVAELNSVLAEYSDEQKSFAKDEIDAFNKNPENFEVNSIVSKICTEIVKAAKSKNVTHEHNSDDIFGYINDVNEDNNDASEDIF